MRPRGFPSLLLLSLACSSNPSAEPVSATSAFAAQPGPPGPTPFIAFIQVSALGLESGGAGRGAGGSGVALQLDLSVLDRRGRALGDAGLALRPRSGARLRLLLQRVPASDGSMLVDYASTSDGRAVLLGLGPRFETAFELSFPTTNCGSAWNAEPIQFGDQSFD